MTLQAVVFDFDGVILDSAHIKTRAFAALFADHPEAVDAVVAFHLANEGVSRHEKFHLIHRDILRQPLTEARGRDLAQRFEELVQDAVLEAPFIAGATATLSGLVGAVPLFVASGTPDGELNRIVDRRGLRPFFAETRGSPPAKAELLAGLLSRHRLAAARVLMVGDAMTDLEAARANGTAFIGIGEDKFPPGVPTRPDLVGLDRHIESVFGLPAKTSALGETEDL